MSLLQEAIFAGKCSVWMTKNRTFVTKISRKLGRGMSKDNLMKVRHDHGRNPDERYFSSPPSIL